MIGLQGYAKRLSAIAVVGVISAATSGCWLFEKKKDDKTTAASGSALPL